MNYTSVVIPMHNAAQFIAGALESVRLQTVPPDEIVIVDDGSQDNSVEIVQRFAQTSPIPVKIIRRKTASGGPAVPLNVAIAAASGKYICVLEQDDLMRPDRIAKQLQALQTFPHAAICFAKSIMRRDVDGDVQFFWNGPPQFTGLCEVPEHPPACWEISSEVATSTLFERQFALTNSALFFQKSLWAAIGGFNKNFPRCTDLAFLFAAANQGPIVAIADELVEYRVRENSLFYTSRLKSRAEVLLLRHLWAQRVGRSELAEQLYWELWLALKQMPPAQKKVALWQQFRQGIFFQRLLRKISKTVRLGPGSQPVA